jgi:predicted DNA-binding protein
MKSPVRKRAVITVRIVNDDAKSIKELSLMKSKTIADVVREAIRQYIDRERKNEGERIRDNSNG